MTKRKSADVPEGTPPVPDDAPPRTDSDAPPPSPVKKRDEPAPDADGE